MKKLLFCSCFILSFCLIASGLAFASTPSQRDALIAQQLNCTESKMQGSVGWSDVCYKDFGASHDFSDSGLMLVSASSGVDAEARIRELEYTYANSDQSGEIETPGIDSDPFFNKEKEIKEDKETSFLDHENPLTKVEMGTSISHVRYLERDLMKTQGNMYGVFINYSNRNSEPKPIKTLKDFIENDVLKFDAKYSRGNVDYDSNGTGSKEGDKDYMFEMRAVIGFDVPTTEFLFTPYVGLGHRYLYNDGRGTTSTGHGGYRRESRYYYAPIGIDVKRELSKTWDLTLNLEYDYFLFGRQKSYLSDVVGGGYPDIKNKQNDGYGARGSVKLLKKDKEIDFFIEPFFRYWNMEDSETTSYVRGAYIHTGIEPTNTSVEMGCKTGIRF